MPEKKHHYDLTEAIEIIERLKAERDDLKSRLAQQGADKVEVQPVGYFQNVNSMNGLPPQYEQVSAVAKSEDDVFPLYRVHVAAQPDPAMAGEVSLLGAANLGLNALHECIVPKGAEVQVSDAMRALRSAINAHTDLRVQPANADDVQTAAAQDVLAERRRQIEAEGWTPGRDDQHDAGGLAAAAAAYALHAAGLVYPCSRDENGNAQPYMWPWDSKWWKPTTPRRDLLKAAALVLAEIERIDRAVARQGDQS